MPHRVTSVSGSVAIDPESTLVSWRGRAAEIFWSVVVAGVFMTIVQHNNSYLYGLMGDWIYIWALALGIIAANAIGYFLRNHSAGHYNAISVTSEVLSNAMTGTLKPFGPRSSGYDNEDMFWWGARFVWWAVYNGMIFLSLLAFAWITTSAINGPGHQVNEHFFRTWSGPKSLGSKFGSQIFVGSALSFVYCAFDYYRRAVVKRTSLPNGVFQRNKRGLGGLTVAKTLVEIAIVVPAYYGGNVVFPHMQAALAILTGTGSNVWIPYVCFMISSLIGSLLWCLFTWFFNNHYITASDRASEQEHEMDLLSKEANETKPTNKVIGHNNIFGADV